MVFIDPPEYRGGYKNECDRYGRTRQVGTGGVAPRESVWYAKPLAGASGARRRKERKDFRRGSEFARRGGRAILVQ